MLTTETTPRNSNRCIVAPPSNATVQQHPQNDATNRAITAQQESLKALAIKRLQRNGTRNDRATEGEKTAHFVARVAGQNRPLVPVSQLPKRLVAVATLYCIEVHQDGPEQINEMLEDLTWHDPADWDALVDHFERQLPPPPMKPIPSRVTCSGCRHAEYRHHPAIAYCGVGVESGNPAGGWWATDFHPCAQREVRTPGKAIHNEEPTC